MLEELATTLKHLTPEKYPGLDSILPEFILRRFDSQIPVMCISQLKIPRIGRRALIVVVP